MIEITYNQIITSSLIIIILSGVVQWLVAKWVSARLEKSIQHEYDKKLEELRFQQLQRQKAETVARLFSKWIKYRGNESNYLSHSELINFYEELNQMSIEISLWIKDGQLLADIMDCFLKKGDAKDIRILSGEIRKLILDIDDKFDPLKIILWPNDEIAETLFKKCSKSTEII